VLTLRPEIVKSNEPRLLHLELVAPEVDAWIRKHRVGADPWAPLFPSPRARDGRWRETPERRVWLKAVARSGLAGVKPNDAGRHSFATHEVLQGTDLKALQEWLGHSSVKTTETYIHVDAIRVARLMRPLTYPRPRLRKDK
jgi:site-specific recombinase XerD